MSAATALSSLLESLGDARRTLRNDPAMTAFAALVQEGVDAWEAALAAIDGGADGAAHLDVVSRLFTVDPHSTKDIHTAEDMVRLGVGTPSHRLMAGLVPVRRELAKANGPAVSLLRRAVALGKRTQSRWRGSTGREAARVDRDLKLEEVRVAVKHLVEDLRALLDTVREQSRPV
ncbi:hypothetical protein ACFQV2_27910 [Actinokineospora soli]|uniref:Uncharacterized protein n=1 Tax=Actinokineospora soli TaxID=1048753 RepID=A0ABW2TTP6_9PSEU